MSIDQCNMAQMDATCGAKFTALGNCLFSNATCDANGKTTVDQSKCSSQLSDYTNCILGGVDAGGGGG
jgi:hypothetical protein